MTASTFPEPVPTIYNTDTELSAVNSVLGSIGQSPVQVLNYENPEVSFVYNLLMESSVDVQNEGWVFNTETKYPLALDIYNELILPQNVLRIDVSEGQIFRYTDLVRRDGKIYDKLNHTYKFQAPVNFDIVWLFPFDDLPSVFKRYITCKASGRAATQLVTNPQLTQLLAQQEASSRAICINYECEQGDYTFMGWPDNTSYRPYQPFQTLAR
jgi:hypothetical protein